MAAKKGKGGKGSMPKGDKKIGATPAKGGGKSAMPKGASGGMGKGGKSC